MWGLLDARDASGTVDAVANVAGIPLVTRHARLAGRVGWTGLVVHVRDQAQADAVHGALARHPAPPSIAIEVSTAPAPREHVPLDARGVYSDAALREAAASGRAPEPLIVVRSRDDAREAQRILTARARKSIDQDGIVAYYFMRPISRALSRFLVHTPVTPNQVTLVAMACGVTAAILAARGGALATTLAGILLWLGAAIDCVDGELARLRLEGSKLGEWLDTLADDVSSFGVLFGLGVGLTRDGHGHAWTWVGAVGALAGFATQAKLYADLHRLRLPIDTSQYPWFFGTSSTGESRGRGAIGTIVYVIGFMFRRDFFVTILAVLFAAGLRRAAVVILLAGVVIMLVILVVHLLVMSGRRPAPS